jgi:hypothetical protein
METNKDKVKLDKQKIREKLIDLRNQVPKEQATIGSVEVWIHGLTSYELEEWRLLKNNPQGTDLRLATAKLLQLAMRDDKGTRIFEPNELAIIAGMPAKDLEPLARKAMQLSGYGIAAEEAILKNLLQTHTDDGSSESPGSTNAA